MMITALIAKTVLLQSLQKCLEKINEGRDEKKDTGTRILCRQYIKAIYGIYNVVAKMFYRDEKRNFQKGGPFPWLGELTALS